MDADVLIQKLDQYGADTAGALVRFLGDQDFYMECMRLFLDDPNPALLRSAIANKEYRHAFEAAHALKGVSANLGLTPLCDAACILVEALRKEQYDNLEAQHAAVQTQISRVKALIEA